MTDPKEVIEWVKINYEQHFKTANLLLAGHGAGIVGCISTVKDFTKVGDVKGIGIFAFLFGVGLLAAIVNYVGLELGRQQSIVAARRGREVDPKLKAKWIRVYTPAMIVSIISMCTAILVFMFRFLVS